MLYKASRPDGWGFRTGNTIDYGTALAEGSLITHSHLGMPMVRDDPSTYISLSDNPAQVLTGGKWPCRLFEAETEGDVIGSDRYPFKVCAQQVRLVRELPSHLALGPNGEDVAAIISRARNLSADEITQLSAAWDAARDAARAAAWDARAAAWAARAAAWAAAWDAAWDAAWAAAWDAAWDAARAAARAAAWAARAAAWAAAWDARAAAWDAARDAAGDAAGWAAGATVVRDLITPEQYQALAGPWLSVIGI